MRLSLSLVLLSTAAMAAQVGIYSGPLAPGDQVGPYFVEFIMPDGTYNRVGGYPTAAECEAAISNVVKTNRGYDGHCVQRVKDGKLIGSRDPAWTNK